MHRGGTLRGIVSRVESGRVESSRVGSGRVESSRVNIVGWHRGGGGAYALCTCAHAVRTCPRGGLREVKLGEVGLGRQTTHRESTLDTRRPRALTHRRDASTHPTEHATHTARPHTATSVATAVGLTAVPPARSVISPTAPPPTCPLTAAAAAACALDPPAQPAGRSSVELAVEIASALVGCSGWRGGGAADGGAVWHSSGLGGRGGGGGGSRGDGGGSRGGAGRAA